MLALRESDRIARGIEHVPQADAIILRHIASRLRG
jgi:hypothetical protein